MNGAKGRLARHKDKWFTFFDEAIGVTFNEISGISAGDAAQRSHRARQDHTGGQIMQRTAARELRSDIVDSVDADVLDEPRFAATRFLHHFVGRSGETALEF